MFLTLTTYRFSKIYVRRLSRKIKSIIKILISFFWVQFYIQFVESFVKTHKTFLFVKEKYFKAPFLWYNLGNFAILNPPIKLSKHFPLLIILEELCKLKMKKRTIQFRLGVTHVSILDIISNHRCIVYFVEF